MLSKLGDADEKIATLVFPSTTRAPVAANDDVRVQPNAQFNKLLRFESQICGETDHMPKEKEEEDLVLPNFYSTCKVDFSNLLQTYKVDRQEVEEGIKL